MVLSSVDISNEIAAGRLSFEPPVEDRIGASSIDLLLHGDLVIPPKDHEEGVIIAPGPKIDIMKFVTNNSESKSIAGGFYQLDPHHLILGRTVERLCLPNYLAGRVEGKSSLARLGSPFTRRRQRYRLDSGVTWCWRCITLARLRSNSPTKWKSPN